MLRWKELWNAHNREDIFRKPKLLLLKRMNNSCYWVLRKIFRLETLFLTETAVYRDSFQFLKNMHMYIEKIQIWIFNITWEHAPWYLNHQLWVRYNINTQRMILAKLKIGPIKTVVDLINDKTIQGQNRKTTAVNVISSNRLTLSKPAVPLFLFLSFSSFQWVINSIHEIPRIQSQGMLPMNVFTAWLSVLIIRIHTFLHSITYIHMHIHRYLILNGLESYKNYISIK